MQDATRQQQLREQHLLAQCWQEQRLKLQDDIEAARAQQQEHAQHAARADALLQRMATSWCRAHSTALLSRTMLGWRRVAQRKLRVRRGWQRAQQHYQRTHLLGGALRAWRITTAQARPAKV